MYAIRSYYGLTHLNSPVGLANIVANDVAKELKDKELNELKFKTSQIAELVNMIDEETISSKIAKHRITSYNVCYTKLLRLSICINKKLHSFPLQI